MKKHGYTMIMVILATIFLSLLAFFILVHQPYQRHHSKLALVKESIMAKENYDEYGDIVECFGHDTYYLMTVKKGKKTFVLAYDDQLRQVDIFQGEPYDRGQLKEKMHEEWQIDVSLEDIQLGYEHETFVYVTTCLTDDHLDYFYYRMDDGTFIRSISFER